MPFLKKKSAALHAPHYGKHLQPSRDWLVLLIAWLVLLLMSIGYHVWLFARVTGGESLEPIATIVEPNELNLDAANQAFESRAEQRTQYLNTYRFIDPSR